MLTLFLDGYDFEKTVAALLADDTFVDRYLAELEQYQLIDGQLKQALADKLWAIKALPTKNKSILMKLLRYPEVAQSSNLGPTTIAIRQLADFVVRLTQLTPNDEVIIDAKGIMTISGPNNDLSRTQLLPCYTALLLTRDDNGKVEHLPLVVNAALMTSQTSLLQWYLQCQSQTIDPSMANCCPYPLLNLALSWLIEATDHQLTNNPLVMINHLIAHGATLDRPTMRCWLAVIMAVNQPDEQPLVKRPLVTLMTSLLLTDPNLSLNIHLPCYNI
jgi:hypothetical protein